MLSIPHRSARSFGRPRGIRFGSLLGKTLIIGLSMIGFAHTGWAAQVDDGDGTSIECGDYNQYRNAYFGDTHVHTTYSVDAYTQGTDTTPDQAYQFAKGTQIGLHPFDEFGDPTRFAQIERSLDFAVVTDHAEFFGEQSICLDDMHPLYNDPDCVTLRERDGNALIQWNVLLGAQPANVLRFDFCGPDGSICTAASTNTWQIMQTAAQNHYDPCTFTSFNGYEWTGAPTQFNEFSQLETLNLHRNVIFRNSIVPSIVSTYLDRGYPELLWNDLETDCLDLVDPGGECDVITIPHNSNLSQGRIFETNRPDGSPYKPMDAFRRQKFEPLIEVFQHKGSSECLYSIQDELCDFELIPWGHLAGNFIGATTPKEEGTVRYVLKEGLALQDSLISNPFSYGMIGSTDTHLGTPGEIDETADYPGHGGAAGGASGTAVFEGITDTPEFNPGGIAVVWAEQNSRGALFDAMRRREVYGTSGPRHLVRFFGGWNLQSDICAQPNLPEIGYTTGMPMGGKLPASGASGGTKPKFVVHALKDPGTVANPGNDLQQIQIIKGWVDEFGDKHEEVVDLTPVPGDGTVNLANCGVSSTVGYAELCHYWEDTNFDANHRTFYYARVVENPSCRWSHRQCLAANPPINCAGTVPDEYASCCDTSIPKTVQERAWTSPIWYNKPPPGC